MTNPDPCPACTKPGMTPWNPRMTARRCAYCGHFEEKPIEQPPVTETAQ